MIERIFDSPYASVTPCNTSLGRWVLFLIMLIKAREWRPIQDAKHVRDIRSDEGLTLETSAILIFHAGNSTFVNWFDKTKFMLETLELRE